MVLPYTAVLTVVLSCTVMLTVLSCSIVLTVCCHVDSIMGGIARYCSTDNSVVIYSSVDDSVAM